MRRDEKLDLDIFIQGSYITDNELTFVLSSSFVISTGVRHLIGFCRIDSLMKGLGLHNAELKQLDNIGPVADI